MKVAIVGTGIAGLGAAYFLRGHCELSVFEQNGNAGGHSNTIEIDEDGTPVRFDTGFMVYNERTYPLLTRLFRELRVATQSASMSFSVQHRRSRLEYNGGSLDLLFVQRRNLLRPSYYRMLRQINRFNSDAPSILEDPACADLTVETLVQTRRYGEDFLRLYLLPMASAVWSAPAGEMLRFPAMTLLRFFQNHGFLGLHSQHPWRTPTGGATSYVRNLTTLPGPSVALGRRVIRVTREPRGVRLAFSDGTEGHFDKVVLACHADEALRLLADPASHEANVLSCFRFQTNEICVHTDTSVMPRRRRAWASWNYRIDSSADGAEQATTHYWMNRLQSLRTRRQYFVSLNSEHCVAPERILKRMTYEHPLFDRAAIAAQNEIAALNGAPQQTTFFAGAWTRYGFHEDGLLSGLRCARAITGKALWQ